MKLAAVLSGFALLSPAFAAVDGVVMNGTTGKPEPKAIVSLVQPGQGGMQTVASVRPDAQGKFHIDKEAPPGPQLVQALYQGVTYTKMIPPGAPAGGLQVDVYDATNQPGVAKVSQHFIVLQPSASELAVSEGILYQTDSKLTYSDPVNGSFRFYLPPEAKGQVQVTINAPGGMPIQRPAEKTKQENVYKVDYPIKPGETRFDLNYTVPASNPQTFSSKILHTEGASDLVVPNGVTLKGDEIELAGQEPKTQASIYRIKNASFKVEVDGMGSLTQADSSSGEENGSPSLQEVKPRIYDRLYWILGMAFAVLGLGSVLLYRSKQNTTS
ncbi:MAG TPA: hypothetical protein VEV17_23755 [Bryobacteraceae bacterium]|nr:hypothetical protein [Bryobacteraceae bacterium]